MNQKSFAIVALGVVAGFLIWLAMRSSATTGTSVPNAGVPKVNPTASGTAATGLAGALASLFGSGSAAAGTGSTGAPVATANGANAVPATPANPLGLSSSPSTLTQQTVSGLQGPSAAAYAANASGSVTAIVPSASQTATAQAAQAGSPPVVAVTSTAPDLSFLGGQYDNSPLPTPDFEVDLGFDASNPAGSLTSIGNPTYSTVYGGS